MAHLKKEFAVDDGIEKFVVVTVDGINNFVVLTVDNGIEEFTFDDGIEKFAVDGINEFVVVTVDNVIKEYAAVAVDDGKEGFAKYFAKNFSPTCYVE